MFKYDEARISMIKKLSEAITCHERGNYKDLYVGFEEMDTNLPRNNDPKSLKLHTALNFWDGWVDASNHEWLYYRGIEEQDWPILAKSIISDLKEDQDITDSLILEWFSQKKPNNPKMNASSFGNKLKKLLNRKGLDREEASKLLIEQLVPYKKWSYEELRVLVGKENVMEIIGDSGTKYYFEIYVAPVNENCDELLVEGSVSKVDGRRLLPETEHAEFGISPDNFIYYQSKNLEAFS